MLKMDQNKDGMYSSDIHHKSVEDVGQGSPARGVVVSCLLHLNLIAYFCVNERDEWNAHESL